jgi:hypothetical protein
MYLTLISQMKKQLGQVGVWFEKAEAHAKAKGFDSSVYLGFCFALDQFAFARQVQITCDTAKLASARVSGKTAPTQADDEKTLAELGARVKSVIAWLDGFTAKDFEGADERSVTQPRWEGKTMRGADYFVEHAVPNFFFHLSLVYEILRHNGVDLGKRDYLGPLSLR